MPSRRQSCNKILDAAGNEGVGRSTHDADDARALCFAGKLGRVDDTGSFTSRVLHPSAFVSVVVHVRKVNCWIRRSIGGAGCDPDDAHGIGRRGFGGSLEGGSEVMGEEEVGNVVDAVLELVALDCSCVVWGNHDACIIPQDVQVFLLCEEFLGGSLDGCEIIELETQKNEVTF